MRLFCYLLFLRPKKIRKEMTCGSAGFVSYKSNHPSIHPTDRATDRPSIQPPSLSPFPIFLHPHQHLQRNAMVTYRICFPRFYHSFPCKPTYLLTLMPEYFSYPCGMKFSMWPIGWNRCVPMSWLPVRRIA